MKQVYKWIMGLIGLILLTIVCIIAYPLTKTTSGTLGFHLYWLYVIGILGIIFFLVALFLFIGKKTWKYLINAFFWIGAIVTIEKYIYPIVKDVIWTWQYREAYRLVVGFSAMLIIIFFWYLKDHVESKFNLNK